MKRNALLLIGLLIVPVIAQLSADQVEEETNVMTGYILAVESDRLNFDEMWLLLTVPGVKREQAVVVIDGADQVIDYTQLKAPCFAEITFQYTQDHIIPVKIKIIKQHHYDDKGIIQEEF
jgi:hypothetical protein